MIRLINNKKYNLIRLGIILANDILLLIFTLNFSYFLRIEYFISFFEIKFVLLVASLIYFTFFFILKLDKQYYRHFNTNSFSLYFKLFILFTFCFSLFNFYNSYRELFYLPRSLIVIFPLLFFFLLIINRLIISYLFSIYLKIKKDKCVVFGFNSLNTKTISSYVDVVYYIDGSKKNIGRITNGTKIISNNEFNKNFQNLKFNQILIQNEFSFEKSKYKIREFILSKGILVQKIIVKNNEIVTSPYFDFNYLFNRKGKLFPINDSYSRKTILITGAGGSIGSNIVSQLLNADYKRLILIDNSEYNLYQLGKMLTSKKNILLKLLNFADSYEIKKIFQKNKIDIVFHAAAYKHVPLLESNPMSGINNNFIETFNFASSAQKFNVPFFCLVSSDKAVRPTNLMGASKRLAELSLSYLEKNKGNNTKFCAVRFGNVINSSGSVLPLFNHQIKNNGPITITHKEITRYFMTIEEAANLVLSSYKIAKGGEIFLLDMGAPIKLLDLAKLVIQFSGKKLKKNSSEKGDIEIKFIGLRDGEKLYEELLVDDMSKQTEIKQIYQSIEKKISIKDFRYIYSQIVNINKSENLQKLKYILDNKYVNYKSNNF